MPFESPDGGNMDDMTMHLTNYAINKHSDTFVKASDGTSGSKRRVSESESASESA